MRDIKLLDCTLRDGGYLNDWNFGYQTIIDTFNRLNNSGIEFIEVGFLDDRRQFDDNRTIQPSTSCYDEIFKEQNTKQSIVVAMIDYGTCAIENIQNCKDSFIDAIRIIFKKPNMRKAVDFAKQVKAKGYIVFLQLVSITSYSDRDLLDLIDLANELDPYAVSIVDTYGLMHKEKMLHYFALLDYNLNPDIYIGFHSHNNFQLAYANAVELINLKTKHNILLDGSVFGMGKNAGNAPIELLCMYLNENEQKSYDISRILEVVDLTALRIQKKSPWGYSLPLFLAASNDCHPNYVTALLKKNTLSVSSINEILKNLQGDDKLNYKNDLLEDLYQGYQKTHLCDKNKEQLFDELQEKTILLLGPGVSVLNDKAVIKEFIQSNNNIVIISVNCIPEFKCNYFFIGNAKRYSMLYSSYSADNNSKIIATSNISSINDEFDYVLNFEKLADDNTLLFDNALIMLLKVLTEANVNKVFLAGFDGFSKTDVNYYNEFMEFSADTERLLLVNDAIKERLKEISEKLTLEFVTESYYQV